MNNNRPKILPRRKSNIQRISESYENFQKRFKSELITLINNYIKASKNIHKSSNNQKIEMIAQI